MSDYFFKNFYDNVKDSSWPKVTNFTEFLTLPKHIQDECWQVHHLDIYLQQRQNIDYWTKHCSGNQVYSHNNVAYLPILKCATRYYIDFFHFRHRWSEQCLADINIEQTAVFALIINPMTRRLKGLVETLGRSYGHDYRKLLSALKDPSFLDFVSRVMITDPHTTPLSMVLEPWFDKVFWIPIDCLSDQQIKKQILYFLDEHGVEIDIPDTPRKNASGTEKLEVFAIIQEYFLNIEPPGELGLMYAKDQAFYHRLIQNYEKM